MKIINYRRSQELENPPSARSPTHGEGSKTGTEALQPDLRLMGATTGQEGLSQRLRPALNENISPREERGHAGLHVAFWVSGVDGGFALKRKNLSNTDKVTVTIDARVPCLLLINRELAEGLGAGAMLVILFWLALRCLKC
ncbi:hypothetical protein FA13DRAFT_1715254 [Coprinellus micaceus]|uniref:Uncharacterized protein n=1 Tax=Coprinellus micaceus TaxID=71717 RepID=A0A4Y7SP02_COPMI|nr:hypothetical protein FA13DRAFT_1715254 [Coprinellus micaceus]